LALRNNGTVVAWGRNDVSASQTNVPAGLSGVTAISAGGSHSLAVKGDTTVVGWGDHWFGQLPVPNGLNNAVTVSSGWQHSLALVVSLYPCISLQPISQFVIAGSTATFTVAAGGLSPLSYQWRLGGADIQGATNATFTLTNVQSGNAGVYSVAVSNIYGTVTSANATLTVATPPVLLTQPASQTVSAGADVTFQVTASGSTPLDYQWRFGGVPIAGATNASLALLGVRTNQTGAFSVVVTNVVGSATSTNAVLTVLPVLGPQWVVAWGENTWGQTNVPPGLSNVIMAAGANEHSVALKSDGTIVAWGGNTLGQTHVPADLTNAVAIAAGGHYSLALKTDGTVAGWGLNNVGQLDIPSGLTNVTAIAAGEAHGVALKGDGTLAVWGYNTYGATNMPAGLSNVVAVTAGSMHSLALKGDSTVVAWGDNRFGQCDMPGGLSNVVAAAGGAMHSLALKADSTVVAWGTDYFGETHVPAGLTNVVAIAAGNTRSLALKRDGSVVTWGATAMGDGTTSASLTNAVAIAAGSLHSLAILGTVPPTQTPPLLQTQFVSSSASFSVSVPTVPGLTYYLEFKTALSDPTWTPLMVVFGDGTTQTLSDSTAGSPQRFYRIRIQ